MIHRYAITLAMAACAAAAVACSASKGESEVGSSREALVQKTCPPGYVPQIVTVGGKTTTTCVPADGDDPPPPPTHYKDACGVLHDVAEVPPTLPATCQRGFYIDGQPVWTCPTGVVPPASMGLVTGSQEPCYDEYGTKIMFSGPGTCEAAWTGSHLYSGGNCYPDAPAGYVYVGDIREHVVCGRIDGGTSGCVGGCAIGIDPPFAAPPSP